jgi:redox-sensing transcriptional repressor
MSVNRPKSTEPGAENGPPKAVVSRLSLYLRELQRLAREGCETTNSGQLGGFLGFSDAQVRKDLAHFGHFGHPGVGYRCDDLIAAIRRILGTDRDWPVAVIGAGNLGQALLGYRGFSHQGFRIVAAFDLDAEKIGATIHGVPVYDLANLTAIVAEHKIQLGLIAAPAGQAQTVADQLVAAGIMGIVNFAPVTLNLPPTVRQVEVDLAMELEQLSFSVVNRGGSG